MVPAWAHGARERMARRPVLGTMVRQQSPAQLILWTPRTLDTAEAAATSLLCPSSTFPGFHFNYRLCGAPGPGLVITTAPLLLTIA